MAYKVIILYQLYMPSYFLGTFTEYPYLYADEPLGAVGRFRHIADLLRQRGGGPGRGFLVFFDPWCKNCFYAECKDEGAGEIGDYFRSDQQTGAFVVFGYSRGV